MAAGHSTAATSAAAAAAVANQPAALSSGTHHQKCRPPELLAVVAAQRTASTTTTSLISTHPCVRWGNEFLRNATPSEALDFARAKRRVACAGRDPRCGSMCTLVFTLFDFYPVSRSSRLELLTDKCTAAVVLRRPEHDRECSLRWALQTTDWGTSPELHRDAGYERFRQQQCNHSHHIDKPPALLEPQIEEWYSRVHTKLAQHHSKYANVSFAEATHAMPEMLDRIYTAFGMWRPERDFWGARNVSRFNLSRVNEAWLCSHQRTAGHPGCEGRVPRLPKAE